MKRLFAAAILAGSLCAEDMDQLAFMAGCWATASGPVTIEEQWNRPLGGLMLGSSRTIKNGQAVFHEFMRIEVKDGKLVYTPRIGAKAETASFTAIRVSGDEVVFENLAHGFPQRVIYRRGANALPARIEGTVNGKLRGEDFPYRKVGCP